MSDGKGSDDWIVGIMQTITESTFRVLEKHPELGISKEGYRAELKKTHPEWLPDLKKEEMQ